MYFCEKCDYSFDISKSVSSKSVEKTELKELKTPSDAIKNIKKDLSKYKPNFTKKELTSFKKYIKLSDKNKEKLNVLFNNKKSGSLITAAFNCRNCGFKLNIERTILLYKLDYKSNDDNSFLEKNVIYSNDPALPRTKDYTCKNESCVTHKKPNLKEAVFYRDNDTYNLSYICAVCNFGWKI